MGYRKDVAYSHSKGYKGYKRDVQLYALAAGMARLKLPPGARPKLSVFISWRKKARIDWTNVVKALEDSLWPQDRNVDPGTFKVLRGQQVEQAHVVVEWCSDA